MKNGKKPKTGSEAGASSGAAAVCIGTPQTIKMEELTSSRLNVHRTRGDEQIKGLAESIMKNGLIQRVVVRPDGDGGYVVVDGHRRVQAARMIGWTQIPVDVIDPDEAGALARMVAANVQRIPNDPILEAEAIERMTSDGMTREEIASALGMDAGYVARRQRLVTLTEPWRAFAKRVTCTTDLLEHVAAHEQTLQIRVAETSGLDEYDPGLDGPCQWSEFESAFMTEMRSIRDAMFDTSECAQCPCNTANHTYLFDFMSDEEGACARCQDAACFARKTNAEIDALVERLRRTDRPVLEVSNQWRVPEYWNASKKQDSKHTQAYVFEQGGVRSVLWSVPPPKKENLALTPEEKAARKAAKRRNALLASARDKVRGLIKPEGGGDRDADSFTFFNSGVVMGRAYNRIARTRLARELCRPIVTDELVNDVIRECISLPALQNVLDDAEIAACKEEVGLTTDTEN